MIQGKQWLLVVAFVLGCASVAVAAAVRVSASPTGSASEQAVLELSVGQSAWVEGAPVFYRGMPTAGTFAVGARVRGASVYFPSSATQIHVPLYAHRTAVFDVVAVERERIRLRLAGIQE